jgi:hypothetical protein
VGVSPAQNQDRNPRTTLRLLCLTALTLLAGCGQTTQVWVWTPGAEGTPADAAPNRAAVPNPQASDRTDPGVAVFGRSGFHADRTPEATRRDGLIVADGRDALPDRLAWPESPRPDLRSTRSVTTSRRAERWVYPDTRRDASRRRHTDFRDW